MSTMLELILVGALAFAIGDVIGFIVAWKIRDRREAVIVKQFANDVQQITHAAEAELFARGGDV